MAFSRTPASNVPKPMRQPYWMIVIAECETETLRGYNDGDLTDTVLDLLAYFERALKQNGVAIKRKFQVSFHVNNQTWSTSEGSPGEIARFTMEVSRPTFHPRVLADELALIEMRTGFTFYSIDEYGVRTEYE